MDFLKKHYEKILLGVMLAGLIGVLVFMLSYIASDKEKMESTSSTYINPHVKKLPDLNLALENGAIERLKTPYHLDLETTNKLLNPMEWDRAMDGSLIPAALKTGARMAVVTSITPLYLLISLDEVITNELGARYVIRVERQAAANPARRRAVPHYVSVGDKANDTFELLQVKGPPANPDALVLKLVDSGDVVNIARNKPYRRVDGYTADFRYDPERKVFRGERIGSRVAFGGEEYAVVEVNPNELILQDLSNQKKTSLPFVP